jgi:hypothetical protein
MLREKQVIASIALTLFAVPVSADPIVNVLAQGSQQFGKMDLATGTFSPIGPIPATIQYLAPGPNGSLLTMSFNGDLDSINRMTGAISVIGPTGFADFHVSRLSRENTRFLTRASEERAKTYKPDSSSHVCLAAVVPALAGPDIHLLPRALPAVADD